MDFAYVNELTNDRSTTPKPSDSTGSGSEAATPTRQSISSEPQRQNLQTEFQETFKAFQSSPWGTKLGGWWSTAQKQGASYYETARKEAEKREAEAAKVLEDARKVLAERTKVVVEAAENQLDNIVNEDKKAELEAACKQQQQQQQEKDAGASREIADPTEEDTETFLARFKSEAAKRLKEVQKAEDAADEALLRFGTNIRSFLKDTISITSPEASRDQSSSEVLFESRDASTGRRVIHTSRFDAQLHVIHTTPSSFTSDPDATDGQWEKFRSDFDIEQRTESIAKDLEKYPDLRSTMEKLVPEQVEYKGFWTRYYFLRHVVELQDEKRKELLKASANDAEEVAWDEDSDTEAKDSELKITKPTSDSPHPQAASHSRTDSDAMTIKPSRRSHDEKSVADSEASYDIVSGAASQANNSPKGKPIKEEESDDDWE